jgi:hypothetical protein
VDKKSGTRAQDARMNEKTRDKLCLISSPHNMETYTATLHGNITTDVKKKKGGGQNTNRYP